jgi:hypothetical protein
LALLMAPVVASSAFEVRNPGPRSSAAARRVAATPVSIEFFVMSVTDGSVKLCSSGTAGVVALNAPADALDVTSAYQDIAEGGFFNEKSARRFRAETSRPSVFVMVD